MIDAVEFRPPPPPPLRLVLRPTEAAKAIGVCVKTLRGLGIPTVRLGDRAIGYSVDDICAFIESAKGVSR
jgi:hypothetical protein